MTYFPNNSLYVCGLVWRDCSCCCCDARKFQHGSIVAQPWSHLQRQGRRCCCCCFGHFLNSPSTCLFKLSSSVKFVSVLVIVYCQYGWSPVIWAAHQGHVDMAQLLLNNGADSNAKQISVCDSLKLNNYRTLLDFGLWWDGLILVCLWRGSLHWWVHANLNTYLLQCCWLPLEPRYTEQQYFLVHNQNHIDVMWCVCQGGEAAVEILRREEDKIKLREALVEYNSNYILKWHLFLYFIYLGGGCWGRKADPDGCCDCQKWCVYQQRLSICVVLNHVKLRRFWILLSWNLTQITHLTSTLLS